MISNVRCSESNFLLREIIFLSEWMYIYLIFSFASSKLSETK